MEATTEVAQESSFERFFTDGYVRLVRAMYLLTGSMAEAEDLAQEAMARVYERWERVQRMESPDGYAFRIAFNLNRRRARRVAAFAHRFVVHPAVPRDPAALAEARNDIMRALLALPIGQRQALVLAELLGMPAEEVGRLLRIRPGTVRMRLHRARESFKKNLGEGYE
jgi:RNA polymerase sigma-70 factor (ECF subfamily)